ncbi:4-hydroxybenzoate octaprenyltransferase [Rickettsiales endosymbiont of Paramecium tredecaurelia]|uniref:UbiA family prenyltransferase n=1 Tax=Candidatus Sarmatiella mevalonica TaxID=2770581 RepID=UPI00192321E3|nr:UbiA family prenyltransferase [Candidatus Sarmatiella mevalonica]MBL3284924.1 4-hydroxybenzoate octaprenyltransferase [Candidatus Sarmatiella mevalonica]
MSYLLLKIKQKLNVLRFALFFAQLARLDKPTGAALLFFTCYFGLMAPSDQSLMSEYVNSRPYWLFIVGSILARSTGCILNDICDQKFDAQIKRTQNRPLANSSINNRQALYLLSLFLLASLFIAIQLNFKSFLIVCCNVVMMCAYPYAKRYIYFPQILLGLTFNASIISYVAVTNTVSIGAVCMYLACACWIVGYDTIYAFMDAQDDARIGVKSIAVLLRNRNYRAFLYGCYGLFICLFVIAGFIERKLFNWGMVVILILTITNLVWQVYTLDITKIKNCELRFKANLLVGLYLCFYMLLLRS